MRPLLVLLLLASCRPSDAPAKGRGVGAGELVLPLVPRPAARPKAAVVSFPDGSRVRVPVADTAQARERGLMFRSALGADEGMLFAFGSDQQLGFWMKNTFVDLDMLWLDGDGKVTTLHERVPKSTAQTPEDQVATRAGFGSYVLELAAGQAQRRKTGVGAVLKLEIVEETP
ncbi:MAG: DUF192 domain-containing protein [Elusimicrobia bacterium]|nr:DUF192 domain-containing protein [Elusimicrobiota bacterium]